MARQPHTINATVNQRGEMATEEKVESDVETRSTGGSGAQRTPRATQSGWVRQGASLKPGDVLAHTYELRQRIGSGGMGEVFEAYDLELQRQVAIKVPLDDESEARLAQEARALARIDHPSIIQIHALGRHEGRRFFVMELVHGQTLTELLKTRERFELEEVVDLLDATAEALQAVHRSGLAHRDVKPSNIMLSSGRLILMDLGLALPEVHATRERAIVGSPAYMAPEVVRGAIGSGNAHRIDIYALGVMAHELLTGKLPFEESDAQEMFRRHLSAPVPDLTHVRPAIPEDLRRLVREMMAKEPKHRPEDMDEVLWRLDGVRIELGRMAEARPILVVDDDSDMRNLIGTYLRGWAPDVPRVFAKNGREAVALINQRTPRLIITDLNMPEMSGLELAMYMQGTRLDVGVPVVALTGSLDEDDARLLRTLGVRWFLGKDDALRERLGSIVRRLLGRRSSWSHRAIH